MSDLKSNCPVCDRERTYKTKQGFERGLTKPCKSCSNSIKQGGLGYTTQCRCGNIKQEGKSTFCRECHLTNCSTYHANIYRYRKYGVTKEWFEEQLELGCAICSAPLTTRAHIDHDHATNKVRGVLCGLCNKGLGQFMDSIPNLRNAITYLERVQ